MKVKFLSLLAIAAVAGAALFTNCAKDNPTLVPATETDVTATERVVCPLTVTVNGPAEFCGTQTNANYCSNAMNANQIGVENVIAAGGNTYNLNAPCVFGVNNPGPGTIKVSIVTGGGNVQFQLNAGDNRKYFVDGACGLTQI